MADSNTNDDPETEQTKQDNEDQVAMALNEDTSSEELTLDNIFEILTNKRRRMVIEYLRSSDKAVSLSELADRIAATENDKPVDELSSEERKRVYVGLYQAHLPKMESAGILDVDNERNHVSLQPEASQLYPYLDLSGNQDDSAPPSAVARTAEIREVAAELRSIADRLDELI